ncbi:MAG: fatty acyl-AMP ligase [Polyangiales bacterium]
MNEIPWSRTVADAIRDAAARRPSHNAFTFCDPREDDKPFTYEGLLDAVRARAAALYALGLRKGDRVAMVVPGAEDFVLNFLGAVLGGLVPVPMYPPIALGKVESYVKNVEHIVSSSGAKVLLISKQVRPILGAGLDMGVVEKLALVENLDLAAPRDGTEPALSPDDLCFLQYTSGSTSAPKGVIVTHGNLAANCYAIMVDGLATDSDRDRGVSWLPLYHDMGLIGFVIAPMFANVPVSFLPTMEFVKRPSYWLEMLHKHKGTITFAPNFAYALAGRRAKDSEIASWDLSRVRVLGCGAEPIQPATLRGFVERLSKCGITADALLPCYGMAEATLAISFARTKGELAVDTVDAASLRDGAAKRWEAGAAVDGDARPVEVVNCGPALPRHEVRVVDAEGNVLGERAVGELCIKGPSVTKGYFGRAEATAEAFRGEWLHSGDLGYLADGAVYVCGRVKDMIIINGRNYYPQDIEWLVQELEGVRKGAVVAFACQPEGASSEQLVIVAEWAGKERPAEDVLVATQKRINDAVVTEMGLNPWKVVLIPAGTIPKTSSGKLQRRKTKDQFESGSLGREGFGTESLEAKAAVAKQVARSYAAMAKSEVMSRLPDPLRAFFGKKK